MWLFWCVVAVALRSGSFGAWVVENGSLLMLAYAKLWVHAACAARGWPAMGFHVSNAVLVEGAVLVQAVLNATLYRATPIIHAAPPHHTLRAACWGALQSTLPVHLVTAVMTTAACTALDCETELVVWSAPRFAHVAMLSTAFRVLSDVVFYATHRAQHTWPRLYVRTHARHHQHRSTSLLTNFQFTAADLWLEGSLPTLVAMLVIVAVAGVDAFALSEYVYCMAAVQWYQIGSHNAKSLPSITAVPPLAPLYNSAWVKAWRPHSLRDHEHVRFHAAHHSQQGRGNYGISPWVDVLCGTALPARVVVAPEGANVERRVSVE